MSEGVLGVVLDRDGVLTTLDRTRLVRDVLSRVPLSEAEITTRWRARLDGRTLRDARDEEAAIAEFLEGLADELEFGADERRALSRLDYLGCVRGFDDAREALLAARRRGLRVAVLTNNSAELSPRRQLAAAGMDELIDVALSSQMIGNAKPHPDAYRAAAAALGVASERCVFLDNTPVCVEGARGVGMSAWQVDRSRDDHDMDAHVVRDLSAFPLILERATRTLSGG
jgi:putative hydrolase of the HAD superfamily